jgi:riboflavin kinase/FMN adenylyltransferase
MVPGNHDGVHLGHRALVARARAHADVHGLRVIAVTFDPHPSAVLAPDRAPTPLTTVARRSELLLRFGAHEVAVQAFTREFAARSAETFLEGLVARGARALVVGPDFRFGQGRAGDLTALRAFGASHGVAVIEEPPVVIDGVRVSSSAVRDAIHAGDVERATQLLGRLHDIDGRVVVGHRRGRTLGFPTANLAPDPVLLPEDGVYAVVVRVPGAAAPVGGVANIGVRPTFAAGRAIEAHLFDFAGDLYDANLRVGFLKRLRDERRFESMDALRAQIALDGTAAREALAVANRDAWQWI